MSNIKRIFKIYDPVNKKIRTYKTVKQFVRFDNEPPSTDILIQSPEFENIKLCVDIDKSIMYVTYKKNNNEVVEYFLDKEIPLVRVHTYFFYCKLFENENDIKMCVDSSHFDTFLEDKILNTTKSTKRSLGFKDSNGNNILINLTPQHSNHHPSPQLRRNDGLNINSGISNSIKTEDSRTEESKIENSTEKSEKEKTDKTSNNYSEDDSNNSEMTNSTSAVNNKVIKNFKTAASKSEKKDNKMLKSENESFLDDENPKKFKNFDSDKEISISDNSIKKSVIEDSETQASQLTVSLNNNENTNSINDCEYEGSKIHGDLEKSENISVLSNDIENIEENKTLGNLIGEKVDFNSKNKEKITGKVLAGADEDNKDKMAEDKPNSSQGEEIASCNNEKDGGDLENRMVNHSSNINENSDLEYLPKDKIEDDQGLKISTNTKSNNTRIDKNEELKLMTEDECESIAMATPGKLKSVPPKKKKANGKQIKQSKEIGQTSPLEKDKIIQKNGKILKSEIPEGDLESENVKVEGDNLEANEEFQDNKEQKDILVKDSKMENLEKEDGIREEAPVFENTILQEKKSAPETEKRIEEIENNEENIPSKEKKPVKKTKSALAKENLKKLKASEDETLPESDSKGQYQKKDDVANEEKDEMKAEIKNDKKVNKKRRKKEPFGYESLPVSQLSPQQKAAITRRKNKEALLKEKENKKKLKNTK